MSPRESPVPLHASPVYPGESPRDARLVRGKHWCSSRDIDRRDGVGGGANVVPENRSPASETPGMSRPFREESLLRTTKFRVVRKAYLDEPEELSRYVIRHHGAVGILPMLADGRIVMIRNYRAAVDEWLLEIPAGTMTPGEAPAQTAHRELEEETGYTAGRMVKLVEFLPSPGISDERMTLYWAGDLVPGQARPEADERLEVAILSRDEALTALASGTVRDAKTIIALLWLETGRVPG